jgi:glycosyltransferase involved in cell wall biosynthesis
MVLDGKTGWLIEYGNTSDFVSALEEVSENPDECRRRIDAAQSMVQSELDLDRQQKRFATYLRNLLSQETR